MEQKSISKERATFMRSLICINFLSYFFYDPLSSLDCSSQISHLFRVCIDLLSRPIHSLRNIGSIRLVQHGTSTLSFGRCKLTHVVPVSRGSAIFFHVALCIFAFAENLAHLECFLDYFRVQLTKNLNVFTFCLLFITLI